MLCEDFPCFPYCTDYTYSSPICPTAGMRTSSPGCESKESIGILLYLTHLGPTPIFV